MNFLDYCKVYALTAWMQSQRSNLSSTYDVLNSELDWCNYVDACFQMVLYGHGVKQNYQDVLSRETLPGMDRLCRGSESSVLSSGPGALSRAPV